MRLGERLLEPIRSGSLHVDWQSDDAEIIVDIDVSDCLGMLARRICVYEGKPEATPPRSRNERRLLSIVWPFSIAR